MYQTNTKSLTFKPDMAKGWVLGRGWATPYVQTFTLPPPLLTLVDHQPQIFGFLPAIPK